MKYLFIMSTKAANGKNLPTREEIENAMVGEDFLIHYTNYRGEPTDVAREYALKYDDEIAVFAIGGDGTINEVVTGIAGTNAYMGVIPSGTGNDFVRTIYPDKKVVDIIKNIKNAKKTKIDLIKLNDHYSINIAGFGFDSQVTERVVKNIGNIKKYGELAYLVAAYQSLISNREYNLEYELNLANGSIKYGKGEFLFGNLANGKYYGGGFMPAPYASVTDGEIDALFVDKLSVTEIISLMFKYKNGEHLHLPQVKTYKVKSGKIISLDKETIANYDGESFSFKELDFKILEGYINFLI